MVKRRYWGNDHWSWEPNATATITFTGTRVALLSVADKGNGIAAISVDGGPEQRIDYYSSIRVANNSCTSARPCLPASTPSGSA